MDQRPIGVFDSGLGGLTAVHSLWRILPEEDLIYFGDTARVPYGSRSREAILKYARQDVRFLRSFDLKAILIACGTVTTTSLAALQAENDLLAQQIDHQKEHYAAITAQYENIRRIRHDIANHLYTMDLLLKEGQYAKAQDYFAEVSQVSRYKSDLGSCENPVVDTFLYARAEDLKAQGFDVEFQVAVPAECGIRNADMVVVFGNLLDNSVEACGQVASPFIRLEAGLRKDYLVVTETNPAPADDTRKKRRIPQLERGIGLHILTDLAGRYHGSCTQEVRDRQFTVSIALQLPENQGETEEA